MLLLQAAQEAAKDVVSIWDRIVGVLIAMSGLGTYWWRQKRGLRTTKLGLIAAFGLVLIGVVVMRGKADLLIDPIIGFITKMLP